MDTIYNLLKRAKELKEKSQVDSITPEEVGKLHEDTLAYIASLEQSAEGLGVRKVYQTKNAMEVDTAPVGTNGKSLRYGQLVAVYDDIHADSPENGNIYVYQKPGWLLMGKVSGGTILSIAQEAGDSTTSVMSQAAVTKALKNVKETTEDGKTLENVYQIAKEDAIFGKERVNNTVDVFNSGKYGLTTDNGYLGLDGNITALGAAAWTYTDFISLKVVKRISYARLADHPSVATFAFYDAGKTFIEKSQSINGEITSFPVGAFYIRFCKRVDVPALVTLYMDGEVTVTVKEKLASASEAANVAAREAANAEAIREITTNIVEYYHSIEKGYINKNYQLIHEESDSGWAISGFMPVFPQDTLEFSGFYPHDNIIPIAFYTKNKSLISGVAPETKEGSVVVPDEAAFMRLSGSISDKWVVKGKMRITGNFIEELSKLLGTGKYDYNGLLDITNSDAVIMEGSSFTEGACQPVGFSWTEKLNDVIDLPVINDGISGSQRRTGIRNIESNSELKSTRSVSKANLSYSYVWFGNTANSSPLGINGYKELLEAKAAAESRGSEMLIGEEEDPHAGNCDPLYRSFANYENVKISNPLNLIGPLCYPNESIYAGQTYTVHKGWRGMSVYAVHHEFFKRLPIKQAIKAYKVRPTKNVSAVADLFFKNVKERSKAFYAISSGQNGTSSSPKITMISCDNLDKVTDTKPTSEYDVQGTVETLSRESELAKLLSGGAVEFSKFALLEFVLNISKLGNAEISFACSVEPSKVYVAAMTEYLQHTATYNNGVVTINVADERCLRSDKISVLVECAGSFNVSTPVCRYKGAQKKMRDFTFTRRKYGVEVLEDTSVQPFSGGTKFSLPSALNLYTKYNTVKSILKLTGEEKATRNFTITERANYAVRVVAQNFFKLMTTRFSGTEYNEFVKTDGVSLQNYQYDKGEVIIMVDDLWTLPLTVESGWTELYFEIPLSAGAHKISIARANDVNVDTPIWLHDISVQKIG